MRSNNARTAAHNNSHSDSAPEKHHANFFDLPYHIFLMLLMVCFLMYDYMANFGFQSRLALSIPFFVLLHRVLPVYGVAPPLGATLARPKKKFCAWRTAPSGEPLTDPELHDLKRSRRICHAGFLIRKRKTKSGILGLYELHKLAKTCKN